MTNLPPKPPPTSSLKEASLNSLAALQHEAEKLRRKADRLDALRLYFERCQAGAPLPRDVDEALWGLTMYGVRP